MDANSVDQNSTIPELTSAIPTLSAKNLTLLSFIVSACLVAFVVFLSRRRSAYRGNALILVGPPDSGKTAILSSMVYGQSLPSHTSIQTNSAIIRLQNSRTLRIVDIPGHHRIRDQFHEYLSDAKAVAFVVDASTVSRNGPSVAEHLHHILHALTSLPPSQAQPSLLILAHKSDLLKSSATSETLAINRVKTILERELEKRRASQAGGIGVEGLGDDGERSDLGGLECVGTSGEFRFADWEGGEVTFLTSSVEIGQTKEEDGEKDSQHGLSALRDWLNEL